MGSCISTEYKLEKSNKMDRQLEDVQIELNMCEKRLADVSNKVIVLHSKLKFTKVIRIQNL